jgi:hypothetical protein
MHRTGAEPIHDIASKYDRSRIDYIEHATELADYADELWNERNLRKYTGRSNRERSQVNAINIRKIIPVCSRCKKNGRSGCGRHLTGNPTLLGETAVEAGTQLVLPEGTRSRSLQNR